MAESKKKALVAAVGVITVLALAIGGTLAYLQDTKTVDRTFTGGDHVYISVEPESYTPAKIIPGKTDNFNPIVTVKHSVDAYAFVQITDQTKLLGETPTLVSGWTPLEEQEGVYYRKVEGENENDQLTVLANNGAITFDKNLTNEDVKTESRTVSLKAYAIQAYSFNDAKAAYQVFLAEEEAKNGKPVLTADELKSALTSGAPKIKITQDITMPESSTVANTSVGTVTIIGENGATLDFGANNYISGTDVTYENLTLKHATGTASGGGDNLTGYYGGIDYNNVKSTYNNCVFDTWVNCYGQETTFNSCTFNPDTSSKHTYPLWVYGSSIVTVNNCTFNYKDRAIKIYNEGTVKSFTVNLNNCKFTAAPEFAKNKALVEIAAGSLNSVSSMRLE